MLSTFQGVSLVLVIGVIVVLTIFLTEVTSNTATTAMLMSILASLAVGLSIHPYGVMIAAATAASFAFMLPVATPPNATVFGSGYITIPQMAKTGVGLNLIGIVLIIILALIWLPLIWGIDLGRLPPWAGLTWCFNRDRPSFLHGLPASPLPPTMIAGVYPSARELKSFLYLLI